MSETSPNASPPATSPPDEGKRSRSLPILYSISTGILLAGVMVGLVLGFQPLKTRAAELQANAPKITFAWPPLAGLMSAEAGNPTDEPRTWMNREIRHDLEYLVAQRVSPDPFDVHGLEAARVALIGTGWLKDDVRLDRDATGIVRIVGTWRIPVAAVRTPEHDVLVTSDGELLPVRYKHGASGFKVIVGVSTPPPNPGEAWIGAEVKTGITLLEYLGSLRCFHQVAGVDLSSYPQDRSLVILTETGNRILWGGAPKEFNPGEPDASVKLARISQLFREYGRIDANRSLVDVRLLSGVFVLDTQRVLAQNAGRVSKTKSKHRVRQ